MDPSKPVFRLEQILRVWEDECFFKRLVAQAKLAQGQVPPVPLAGPVAHAPAFRRYVLDDQAERFDTERFLLPLEAVQAMGSLALVPAAVWSWAKSSRRIYRVTEDLQALLNATSLKRMRWSDVEFPFQAFAVTLDAPIANEKGVEFDCILVAYDPGEEGNPEAPGGFMFHLLSRTLAARKPVSFFDREQLQKAVRTRDWHKLDRRLKDARESAKGWHLSRFTLLEDKVADEPVTESISRLVLKTHATVCNCGGTHPEWDVAARIVVGLCLYLQSLGPKDPCRPVWTKAPKALQKTGAPRVISDEAELCVVGSTQVLTSEEREAFLGHGRPVSGGEKRPHWREGHYRRKPGQGNDPDAPKIVHVKPTLVRRDLLAGGQLPEGSAMTVK